jgi:sugar/nucleoside kinase (ribokinase family)
VWSRAVGLVGAVGRDFPDEHWAALQQMGIDLRGVRRLPLPTPRAWQIYDATERRTEIFRSPQEDFPRFLPTPEDVSVYPQAVGFSLMTGDLDAVGPLCDALRGPGRVVLWEPAPWHMTPDRRRAVLSLLRRVDIFAPNAPESAALLGEASPDSWLAAYLDAGVRVACVRMGREGSVVQAADERTVHHIPALVLGPPVDVTGAGNAYCGGFLVGYCRTGRADLAGRYGAISAAVTLGHLGVPLITDEVERQARHLLVSSLP